MEQEGYVGPAFRNRPRAVNRSAVRLVGLLYAAEGEQRHRQRPDGESSRRRERRARRGANGGSPRRLAHEVLGVASTATREQVTAAYHELAQMYHPDKMASLAPEFQEVAERRMKEINAAYRAMIKRG